VGSILSSSQNKKLKILVFTTSLFDIHRVRDNVKNKPANSLDVTLGRAVNASAFEWLDW